MLVAFALVGCAKAEQVTGGGDLTDAEIDNLVRRSYQYVAMYNVINKSAMMEENPTRTGWNGTYAAAGLLDHTMRAIARPNNDTLYVTTILDLRAEPIIVSYPVFDSKFVALETSAYDHYVDIPLSTTKGDFQQLTRVVYPGISSADGEPMNALHDYVVRMTADEMPPATAFWSVTLYDTENGFFIPNDRKNYSVGENAGFELDEDGGIEIHIAAEQPEEVPDDNWLAVIRRDEARWTW